MTVATFKMKGREYVIVPRAEYELTARRLEEDARDVKKAKATLAHYRRRERGISLEQLKQEARGS